MNTKNTIEHSAEFSESEISLIAYQQWERAGRPSDRNLQFWLDAEAQLRATAKAARATPTAHFTGDGKLGPSQPNSPKPGQKSRRH